MKDKFGQKLYVGDKIVYGKSDRWNPINAGIIKNVYNNYISVLGTGNKRTGDIDMSERIIKLSENLHSYIK
jgi:hypothetical protein